MENIFFLPPPPEKFCPLLKKGLRTRMCVVSFKDLANRWFKDLANRWQKKCDKQLLINCSSHRYLYLTLFLYNSVVPMFCNCTAPRVFELF